MQPDISSRSFPKRLLISPIGLACVNCVYDHLHMKTDRTTDSAAAERIRRAAIEAFAESGYGGSSTRQIAKRLNMSATAMYPHYRSKEELLYAIALEGHGSLLATLRATAALQTTPA